MSLVFWLNIFDAVIVLGVAVPAVAMAMKIRNVRLRALGALLASFLVVHGVYHGIAAIGGAYGSSTSPEGLLGFVSEGITEPLSYAVLLIFSVALYRLGAR